MARRDANIGGLAALGALAALMNQRRQDNLPPVVDRSGTAIPAVQTQSASPLSLIDDTINPDVKTGRADVYDERGLIVPGVKRNTETNELFYPNGMPNAPVTNVPARRQVRSPAARSQRAASAPDPWMDDTPSLLDTNPNMRGPDPLNPDPRSKGRRASVIQTPVYIQGRRYPPNPANLQDSNVPFQTFRMKKGGEVKSVKKMASGGMTSMPKSRRGDGIAQKGKTKGRYL